MEEFEFMAIAHTKYETISHLIQFYHIRLAMCAVYIVQSHKNAQSNTKWLFDQIEWRWGEKTKEKSVQMSKWKCSQFNAIKVPWLRHSITTMQKKNGPDFIFSQSPSYVRMYGQYGKVDFIFFVLFFVSLRKQ